MSASINILRIAGVSKKTGLSKSSIWKGISEGTFPAPLELGPKARGWRESDINEWLESRPVAQTKSSKAGV